MPIITAEEAVKDIRSGKMVIIVDDEDRENEGDLAMAADKVTPESINFMATHARGLICVPMMADRLRELQLPIMVLENTARLSTAFTVSVDGLKGTSTGISADDRAATIKTLIDPKTTPDDLARPGHTFPLRYTEGGVMVRAGQTEAIVDLVRLGELYPAGVICEIQNLDGSMARLPELKQYALERNLKLTIMKTIALLLAFLTGSVLFAQSETNYQ